MELKTLLDRLKDSDPWVRVEALRILAMVEETRSLSMIEWVFKNDPEPGVRQVAQWAGKLVWQAQKEAPEIHEPHPKTIESKATQSRQEIEEEIFLARLVSNQANSVLSSAMQVQALQYELNQTLLDAAAKQPPPEPKPEKKADDDAQDLLTAGLSGDLFD